MAALKWTGFFTFLVLFAFMEEANLAMAYQVSALICKTQKHIITCPPAKIPHIQKASYGRQSRVFCPAEPKYTLNTHCHSANSLSIVEATCAFKYSCELFSDNSVFGDPCPGTYKYLTVRYRCAESFVLCEGNHGNLSCPSGKNIRLFSASYGRHDRTTCKASEKSMNNTNCHSGKSHSVVEEKCKYKPSCELYADNSVFDDPCPGTYKYLMVVYECV